MSENSSTNNGNLTIKESISILFWVLKMNYEVSPLYTVIYGVVRAFNEVESLINAYLFGMILDRLISIAQEKSDEKVLIPYIVAIFAYNLLTSLFRNLENFCRQQIREKSRLELRQKLYFKLNAIGIQKLEDPDFVNNIQRARETIYMVTDFLERLIQFIGNIVKLVVSAIVVLIIMPWMLPFAAFATLPTVIVDRYFSKKDWRLYRDNTEFIRKYDWDSYTLMESRNLEEIKVTNSFDFFHRRFRIYVDFWLKSKAKLYKKWYSLAFIVGNINEVVLFVGYYLIFRKLLHGAISIGQTTFQYSSLGTFYWSTERLGMNLSNLYEASIKLKDAKDLFDAEPAFEDGKIKMKKLEAPPIIKLYDVKFTYPRGNKEVLKGINLEIKPGEKIAIVGENGTGKTTLMKLLCRFYKCTAGEILIDENNINNIKIDTWYKNLGMLSQDYNAYSNLTAKENILVGDPLKKDGNTEIIEAAEKADAHDFINKYENKYDQILSEKFKGGTRPSKGQWQKIAIARFFYRHSPVLIFDEPTAAIDAVAESKIFNKIYSFFKDKTVIIISHRFSTVRNADRILVMNDGQFIEEGTHAELMKRNGKYAEAFKLQAEGYN